MIQQLEQFVCIPDLRELNVNVRSDVAAIQNQHACSFISKLTELLVFGRMSDTKFDVRVLIQYPQVEQHYEST